MTAHLRGRPVVVGVDGSDSSADAASAAVEEAARRGTELHLVHALSWPAAAAPASGMGPAGASGLGGFLHAAAETALRTAAADAADALGPDRVRWSVVPGAPATALTDAARGAEVLVLGSRGAGGVTGLLLGSTAAAILAEPPCPVLLMPDPTAAVVRPRATVVVAVEGRPDDDAVLAFAFPEAARRQTDLLAVHAWQDVALETALLSAGPLVDWAGVLADERRVLAEALAGWRDKEPDVTVREAVVRDRPARALLAAGLTAQVLVLGSRRHRALARLGSTTRAVVHRAPCPVAVVPLDLHRGSSR
ncbi:universal stress protein [Geodermatophilus nigrescens]|uniref:universal stress protein n=1 Tax=Geodermatophilus sp. FMUSA9-8 TaxID=3120155 RepID=UPI00300A85BA